MVIEPSTDIYILANCPLEPSYDHTLHWSDSQEQEQYFLSLAKFKPTTEHGKATYQRVNIGYARVEVPVEKLYNCNYMMFRNEYFENKWFYAFITSVEYVNNKTSLINYSIDYMQSWYWDYQLLECFVEREHTLTDEIGDNTIPENLDFGEYEPHYLQRDQHFNWSEGDFLIAVVSVYDSDGNQDASYSGLYGGVYSGLHYDYFESLDGGVAATNFIQSVVDENGEDGIIAIYMLPRDFKALKNEPLPQYNQSFGNVEVAGNWTYYWQGKSGPRNNKLYTYPFNVLTIDDMAGNHNEYRYEFLNDKTKFEYTLEGMMDCPPKVLFTPRNYKNISGLVRTESMLLDGFPQASFVTDSYRAWVAMNYRQMNVKGAASIIEGVGGVLSGIAGRSVTGIASGLVSPAVNIASMIAERETHKTYPNEAHMGKSGSMAIANQTYGINLYNMRIRPEYAKIIDDYFDRYGYAVHTNKVPNTNARPHWTYTKTVNCTIKGDVPADDIQKIIAIYNRGITFWNHPEEVGDYSLNNAPYPAEP